MLTWFKVHQRLNTPKMARFPVTVYDRFHTTASCNPHMPSVLQGSLYLFSSSRHPAETRTCCPSLPWAGYRLPAHPLLSLCGAQVDAQAECFVGPNTFYTLHIKALKNELGRSFHLCIQVLNHCLPLRSTAMEDALHRLWADLCGCLQALWSPFCNCALHPASGSLSPAAVQVCITRLSGLRWLSRLGS